MKPWTFNHILLLLQGWVYVGISFLIVVLFFYLEIHYLSMTLGVGVLMLSLTTLGIKIDRIEGREKGYPFPFIYLLASVCPFSISYILIMHIDEMMDIRPLGLIVLIWVLLHLLQSILNARYEEKKKKEDPYRLWDD